MCAGENTAPLHRLIGLDINRLGSPAPGRRPGLITAAAVRLPPSMCRAGMSRLPYPNPSPPTDLTDHPVTLDLLYPEWTFPRIPIPIVAPRGGRGTYITYRLYSAYWHWQYGVMGTRLKNICFINLVPNLLNGLICEARARSKQSLLRRSWPLQSDLEIPGSRQNLETKV